MPVSYAQRRRRRQQLAKELPPELQGRIALRNIEAVAKLSADQQQRLASAIVVGVKVPTAIHFLKEHPRASVDELLQAAGKPKKAPQKGKNKNLALLADLLQACFPDMPRPTADAMAGSELLSEVLGIICAQQACFASKHAESEFVIVVLCGLVITTRETINQIIPNRTIYRKAIQQSGLEWPF